MLHSLKEWEENRFRVTYKLPVVWACSDEANRGTGLSSTVVVSQQLHVGRAFEANGAGSAVLVDAEGNVASGVTLGAPAVMELAGEGQTRA